MEQLFNNDDDQEDEVGSDEVEDEVPVSSHARRPMTLNATHCWAASERWSPSRTHMKQQQIWGQGDYGAKQAAVFILERMWPWKIASEIRDILVRVPGLNGLNNIGTKDPTPFSFGLRRTCPQGI
ncbi:hypothetical protein MHU86_4206 [Fragilaria crotonensis]|nr:hypothetical protein MHU86_4206 [Fragilaria crotonensis]